MKEIGSLQQSADSASAPYTLSHRNNRPNHEASLTTTSLEMQEISHKIYVNDLSICDFKLIHYCTKNDVTECVGTQELGD